MEAHAESRMAPRPGLVLAILAFGGCGFSMLQSLVVPALPTLQHELDTTPAGVAWIFTTYLLAASVATPVAGRFGDMFGKKRTLLVVLAGLAAGTLLAALSSSLAILIVARAIQGIGGAIFPLAFGIIRDEFPRERVPSSIGLISGLLGIGGALGIVLAGPILSYLDYHWLFWIPLCVVAATLVATWFLVPESPVRAPGRVDWAGAALLSAWLVCLLVPISEAPTWGWTSARTLGLVGLAVVLAAVWVEVERRTPSPLVDMRTMRERSVWTTNLVGFVVGWAMFGAFILLAEFVQTPASTGYGFGSTVTESGFFLIPSALTMMIGAPLSGRLSMRVGPKPPLVIGVAITMLSFLVLVVAHSAHWQIYLASVLLGIGVGFAYASMTNVIVTAVRPDQTGIATGMNSVSRTIGGAVGGQVAATILASTLLASGWPAERGYTISFLVSVGVLAVGTLVALAVPGRAPRRAQVRAAEPTLSVE